MGRKKTKTEAELRRANADRVRKSMAYSLDIPAIKVGEFAKKSRRRRCAKSAAAFIATYCTACPGGFLKIPPPPKMAKIIDEMQKSVTDGGLYQIMMPRGHGKSSYVKGVVAWAIAYGHKHFIEVVAANLKKAEQMLRDVRRLFERSPLLKEDFPEICLPLEKLEGKPTRAASVTVDGEPTNMRISADEMDFPTVDGSPSSGAILLAIGFRAASRGSVVGTQRPDLIIFDDIQTTDIASSEERVDESMDLINADFLGSSSHLEAISAMMTSTPIRAGDLCQRITDSGAWQTRVFRMLESFPTCHGAKDGTDLWAEYAKIRQREAVTGGDRDGKCAKFYRAHRAAMDSGAEVLNEKNFTPAEVSAIQHAMNLLIDRGGKAFDAEYQMSPRRTRFSFEISARMILSRVRHGTEMGFDPPGTVLTVAATDINPSYALSTAIIRFDVQRTAFVCAYMVTPCRISDAANDTEFHRRVYETLATHGRALAALGIRFDAWGVDAGGKQFPVVTRFAQQSVQLTGMPCIPMTGRAGKTWNPNVRSRIRNALNDTVYCRDPQGRIWMAWNADAYKESAQKAWGTETGAPGGCSIFDAGLNHVEFATQVANERLVGKQMNLAGQIEYLWKTKEPHDFGDCMAMCFALAGSRNVTGANAPAIEEAAAPKVVEVARSAVQASDSDDIEVGCDF